MRRRAAFLLGSLPLVRPAEATTLDRALLTEPMARALALRDEAIVAGDQGYGAVIWLAGRIVGEAPSRVVQRRDPTAHAELEALRDALARLGTGNLAGAWLLGSSRACPMCEAAAAWSGIERMVWGRDLQDAGAPRVGRC